MVNDLPQGLPVFAVRAASVQFDRFGMLEICRALIIHFISERSRMDANAGKCQSS
jgi:hypothetical protein